MFRIINSRNFSLNQVTRHLPSKFINSNVKAYSKKFLYKQFEKMPINEIVINAPKNFDANELDFVNVELEIKYLKNEEKIKNDLIEFSNNKDNLKEIKEEECIVYTESLDKLVDLIGNIHFKIRNEKRNDNENSTLVPKTKDKEDELILNIKEISNKYSSNIPAFMSIFQEHRYYKNLFRKYKKSLNENTPFITPHHSLSLNNIPKAIGGENTNPNNNNNNNNNIGNNGEKKNNNRNNVNKKIYNNNADNNNNKNQIKSNLSTNKKLNTKERNKNSNLNKSEKDPKKSKEKQNQKELTKLFDEILFMYSLLQSFNKMGSDKHSRSTKNKKNNFYLTAMEKDNKRNNNKKSFQKFNDKDIMNIISDMFFPNKKSKFSNKNQKNNNPFFILNNNENTEEYSNSEGSGLTLQLTNPSKLGLKDLKNNKKSGMYFIDSSSDSSNSDETSSDETSSSSSSSSDSDTSSSSSDSDSSSGSSSDSESNSDSDETSSSSSNSTSDSDSSSSSGSDSDSDRSSSESSSGSEKSDTDSSSSSSSDSESSSDDNRRYAQDKIVNIEAKEKLKEEDALSETKEILDEIEKIEKKSGKNLAEINAIKGNSSENISSDKNEIADTESKSDYKEERRENHNEKHNNKK